MKMKRESQGFDITENHFDNNLQVKTKPIIYRLVHLKILCSHLTGKYVHKSIKCCKCRDYSSLSMAFRLDSRIQLAIVVFRLENVNFNFETFMCIRMMSSGHMVGGYIDWQEWGRCERSMWSHLHVHWIVMLVNVMISAVCHWQSNHNVVANNESSTVCAWAISRCHRRCRRRWFWICNLLLIHSPPQQQHDFWNINSTGIIWLCSNWIPSKILNLIEQNTLDDKCDDDDRAELELKLRVWHKVQSKAVQHSKQWQTNCPNAEKYEKNDISPGKFRIFNKLFHSNHKLQLNYNTHAQRTKWFLCKQWTQNIFSSKFISNDTYLVRCGQRIEDRWIWPLDFSSLPYNCAALHTNCHRFLHVSWRLFHRRHQSTPPLWMQPAMFYSNANDLAMPNTKYMGYQYELQSIWKYYNERTENKWLSWIITSAVCSAHCKCMRMEMLFEASKTGEHQPIWMMARKQMIINCTKYIEYPKPE